MYIDSHCQLQFSDYDEDRKLVIGNAKKAGVKAFVVPGVDAFSSEKAVLLAQENPGCVFAAVGFHPYESPHNPDISLLKPLLSQARRAGYVVAIGECGLDYHLYKGEIAGGKKDLQKTLLESHLKLALSYDLPVILHTRDAYDDMFDVLDSMPTMPRGVLHCFSGGLQDIRMAQERGLSIGIDGNVTYAKSLSMMVPHIPLSMILLETDAPYLTPVPHRGKRNEPKYIPLIAEKIAELHKISKKEVEKQTTQNTARLFHLISA